ncbi:hypothetical protein KUCAC02_033654 [Chaenocephalus aceratus]|nr:hypothetical protein KUCAC02_033654 [Chaenocephalus aceratus]
MNLTDCVDAFMKRESSSSSQVALLDFQIQRYFIPAPPHLCKPPALSTHADSLKAKDCRDAPPETSVPYFSNNAP